MDQIKEFLVKHKWAIILTIVGILYVLLCIELGFWRTVVLTVIPAVCCFMGASIHKNKKDGLDD